jgi:hypothetical protein
MKFSRSDFEMQRFESRSPRLESWRISIPECGGSNPAGPASQSVSNASHMKVGQNPRGTARFRRYELVSVCGIRRWKRHSCLLSPRAFLRVSFLVLAQFEFVGRCTHLGLSKDAPRRRAVQRTGTIVTTQVLSGLHHRYARTASVFFSRGDARECRRHTQRHSGSRFSEASPIERVRNRHEKSPRLAPMCRRGFGIVIRDLPSENSYEDRHRLPPFLKTAPSTSRSQ